MTASAKAPKQRSELRELLSENFRGSAFVWHEFRRSRGLSVIGLPFVCLEAALLPVRAILWWKEEMEDARIDSELQRAPGRTKSRRERSVMSRHEDTRSRATSSRPHHPIHGTRTRSNCSPSRGPSSIESRSDLNADSSGHRPFGAAHSTLRQGQPPAMVPSMQPPSESTKRPLRRYNSQWRLRQQGAAVRPSESAMEQQNSMPIAEGVQEALPSLQQPFAATFQPRMGTATPLSSSGNGPTKHGSSISATPQVNTPQQPPHDMMPEQDIAQGLYADSETPQIQRPLGAHQGHGLSSKATSTTGMTSEGPESSSDSSSTSSESSASYEYSEGVSPSKPPLNGSAEFWDEFEQPGTGGPQDHSQGYPQGGAGFWDEFD